MRGVHAAIFCLLAALDLSGRTRASMPFTATPPRFDQTSVTCGRPDVPGPIATADAADRLDTGDTTLAGSCWF